MLKAVRGNVVLRIPDNEADRYLAKGFDIKDMNGKVVSKTTPTTMKDLQEAYEEKVAEVEKLKAELDALKSTPKKEEKKPEKELVEEPVEEEVPQPKKKTKKEK